MLDTSDFRRFELRGMAQYTRLPSWYTRASQLLSCGSGMLSAPQLVGSGQDIGFRRGTVNSSENGMGRLLDFWPTVWPTSCSSARFHPVCASATTVTILHVSDPPISFSPVTARTWQMRNGKVVRLAAALSIPVSVSAGTRSMTRTRGCGGAIGFAEPASACAIDRSAL